MEYTVSSLAKLSGVSSRTLRYYDQIDLLKPARINQNSYRVYSDEQVDILQQILFYRELSFSLDEIKIIISSPNFNKQEALKSHLSSLKAKEEQLSALILNVSKTLSSLKGEAIMQNEEKFEGFKKKSIKDNEEKYGAEIRAKYGAKTIDASNSNFLNMSKEKYERTKELEAAYLDALKEAMKIGDPSCPKAKEACAYHKEWLLNFWTPEMFSEEAHKSLVEGYALDERFKKFYDDIEKGLPEFFQKAIQAYYD